MRVLRLLAAAIWIAVLTNSVALADGPDLTVEYVGWEPDLPNLVKFVVRNNGDAASEKTTGKGLTVTPAPPQETAPPIPALDPAPLLIFITQCGRPLIARITLCG